MPAPAVPDALDLEATTGLSATQLEAAGAAGSAIDAVAATDAVRDGATGRVVALVADAASDLFRVMRSLLDGSGCIGWPSADAVSADTATSVSPAMP